MTGSRPGRGDHPNDWAEALQQMCEAADLTIPVPKDAPNYVLALYETLGVSVIVDEALPPHRESKSVQWRRDRPASVSPQPEGA